MQHKKGMPDSCTPCPSEKTMQWRKGNKTNYLIDFRECQASTLHVLLGRPCNGGRAIRQII